MFSFRGPLTRIFITIALLFGFSGIAQARVYSTSDLAVSAVNSINDIDWTTVFPEVTAVASPDATPVASPGPDEPDGYALDANDHLAAVVSEGLKLNIDGLALEPVNGYAALRFELKAKAEAPTMAVTTSIRMKSPGSYDLRIFNYDAANYDLSLKITSAAQEKSYSLKPNSRILFSASYLEAILFDGDTTPEAGAHPDHYIAIEEEYQTIFAGSGGILMMEARPTPGSFTPQTPSTPETPNGGTSNPPNPSTDVPSGGSPNNDDTSNIPPGFSAGIGGGGSLLSCSLATTGGDVSAIAASGIGLTLLAGMRLRQRRR